MSQLVCQSTSVGKGTSLMSFEYLAFAGDRGWAEGYATVPEKYREKGKRRTCTGTALIHSSRKVQPRPFSLESRGTIQLQAPSSASPWNCDPNGKRDVAWADGSRPSTT